MKMFFIIILISLFLTACKNTPTPESQKQMLKRHYDQLQEVKVADHSVTSMDKIPDVLENHPMTPELITPEM